MGTPGTTFNLTNNREARNAIFAAIALASIAFLSLSILVSPLLNNQKLTTFTIIEVVVIVAQILTIIFSVTQIFQGKVEPAAWRLVYSFMVTAIARTLLRESIGLPFGILSALIVPVVGYLTLPTQPAARATILGYAVGSAIVIFDLYAGNIYIRQSTSADLEIASRNLALFVFVIQLAVLATQSRSLNLTAKIANYFSLFTLTAIVAVGTSGILIVANRLAAGGNNATGAALTLETLRNTTIVTGAVVAFFGAVLGTLIATSLTKPLQRLSQAATQIASGDLKARAHVDTEDEIGLLGGTFNDMADSLKDIVDKLESKVEERTKDIARRAVQMQTAADIGRAATSLRDLESLLVRTAQLISDRFGYYHTGIFLLDETNEYAVLHAASSEGGLVMLERGHRLKIGETGIVGYVTREGKARIALDVGQDAVFFDNPYLPDTRSEMALPLIASGRILGALDVQSTESQAFSEEDIATLHILADQLAIAIENARLFGESQKALDAARIAYGEITREAWVKILKSQPRVSYLATPSGNAQELLEPPSTEILKTLESGDLITSSDGRSIGVPVLIRGKAVGVLRLKKSETASPWNEEEIALAIAISEQLGGALESARLYKESQQRAARESLVSDISARISSLPRVDTILRETAQELGQAIGNATVTFHLLESTDGQDQDKGW